MLKQPIKIAIIYSEFNQPVTSRLLNSAMRRAEELNIPAENVLVTKVPGAVELPLIAQQYARQRCVDAIVCLGAVIRGETSHYECVCQQVSKGCQQVALEYNIPVAFGVLTTENLRQALARSGGEHSDMGRSSLDTAVVMIERMRELTTSAHTPVEQP